MSGIEQIAKSWLSDPPWQKVFKHTVDVVADYISYILVKLRFSEKATKMRQNQIQNTNSYAIFM